MAHSTSSKFPFPTVLSLTLLIEHWEKSVANGEVPAFGQALLQSIEAAPELKAPIYDPAILQKHKPLIDFLLTAVIPAANHQSEMSAAILPFEFTELYSTPAFQQALNLKEIETCVTTNLPNNKMILGKTVKAFLMILRKFYGVKVAVEKPIHFTIKSPATGLDRVYRVEINHQFCEIISKGKTSVDTSSFL